MRRASLILLLSGALAAQTGSAPSKAPVQHWTPEMCAVQQDHASKPYIQYCLRVSPDKSPSCPTAGHDSREMMWAAQASGGGAYFEVLDCSWHGGRNPRDSMKPKPHLDPKKASDEHDGKREYNFTPSQAEWPEVKDLPPTDPNQQQSWGSLPYILGPNIHHPQEDYISLCDTFSKNDPRYITCLRNEGLPAKQEERPYPDDDYPGMDFSIMLIDVPPIEEEYGNPGVSFCDMGACVWYDYDPKSTSMQNMKPIRRKRETCSDKTRFLMTSEDGKKHCIRIESGTVAPK